VSEVRNCLDIEETELGIVGNSIKKQVCPSVLEAHSSRSVASRTQRHSIFCPHHADGELLVCAAVALNSGDEVPLFINVLPPQKGVLRS
jgi:hypothetical protein